MCLLPVAAASCSHEKISHTLVSRGGTVDESIIKNNYAVAHTHTLLFSCASLQAPMTDLDAIASLHLPPKHAALCVANFMHDKCLGLVSVSLIFKDRVRRKLQFLIKKIIKYHACRSVSAKEV
jgi:hypothetical protein